ncbi:MULTISPECIES: pyrroloquinoline quinone biosynthesis peptide chaperone PqqD [Prauserella salsuginis group]|uniref:Pyrroloquinoline quinone biosynthesis protein D n=2 Tax=Prauserella salsuginis group TaxID=2893672 RepID=A0A839XTG2_9PSEU|nr:MULTISPECIES: pyrroloquinoline quinone biosynthesis peptide chaperone PqqD [Prauserella salsuginis group]MBB3663883.1 pyrroloquinoline quinone biosynthesis protein D [Prauserella sediminis]MCR3718047.1 pyrroloquinoline quinone biosynthesis protein D [Prauserella flava]MCR3732620.1 pyrroloquinoline quinone biosynthesis protein D [Prauserella salsuginis]
MDESELTDKPRLASKAMLRHDNVRDVELLLLPERVVLLNKSGAAILGLCDGNRTVQQVVEQLEQDFEATDLLNDVMTFLKDARGRGWVVT